MSKTLVLLLTLLGGFRGIVSEVVWFRMDRLQEQGRFSEMAQLAGVLTQLEPQSAEVWSYAAWNLAYNVSVMMPTHADRWRWVAAGLKLLRDDGLRLNPKSPELHRELAWLFLSKIGGNLDEAAPLYAAEWKKRVTDVRARGAWSELAMDATSMARVEKRYGALDWTDPKASALYFADEGLAPDVPPNRRAELFQVLYQTLIAMSLTDAAKAPYALATMRAAYEENPSPHLAELITRYRAKFKL